MTQEAAVVMADVGHLVIDDSDRIVQADDGSTSILSRPSSRVIGRLIFDLVVDEDRETFARCLHHLRLRQRPFRIAKRMRRDGHALWVESTVGLTEFGHDGAQVMVTIVPIADPERFADPRALLTFTLGMLAARHERDALFGRDLFVDPAWTMILACYVAEAEGKALDVAALGEASGAGPSAAHRWIKALVARGLLEPEDDGSHVRLSHQTHRQFERWLSHSLLKLSVHPDIA